MKDFTVDKLFEKIVNQINSILKNEEINQKDKLLCQETHMVQEALLVLSNSLLECNDYLHELTDGNINITPPSRYNYLSSGLKELQSELKHFIWQANRVSQGDYNQQVDFLGEFSQVFNSMAKQLKQREEILINQAKEIKNSQDLLIKIMDGLNSWIIVTKKDSGEILYINNSAKSGCLYSVNNECKYLDKCELIQSIKQGKEFSCDAFKCEKNEVILKNDTYTIQWNEDIAVVNMIYDITAQSRVNNNMIEMAYRDELTGMYNRRCCIETVQNMIKTDQEFSIVMVDLNDLKKVNDIQGHCVGDKYLTVVSSILKSNVRGTDYVCRIGGDEFIIIFVSCNQDLVEKKMEKISKIIINIREEFDMSISYGVCEWDKNMTYNELIQNADDKMYEQKRKFKANKSTI